MDNTAAVWVCTDCMVLLANGEPPTEPTDCEPLNLFRDNDGISRVSVGMTWADHDDECPNRQAEALVTECSCEHDTFSCQHCDGCGSHLGGERFAATLWLK